MSQIPRTVPNTGRQADAKDMDELAALEAQREQLQAMVAGQAKGRERLGLLVPGLMIVLAVLVFFGLRSGELAAPTAILTLAIGVSLLFLLRRQIRQLLVAGPDARESLAECEASISRLRESRS